MLLQVSIPVESLNQLLDNLYDEMLPLCADLINVGRALGGLGALVFIASKVWRSMAEAEPIDVFPLLRPFAIGLVITFFPAMLGLLNGVLEGISSATNSVVRGQNQSIIQLQERKKALLAARPENAPYETDEAFDKELESKKALDFGGKAALYFDRLSYDVQKNFREWIRNALELLHDSAALVINTIRTFFLIILSIIGPISFGFAIWPGFEGTLTNWFSRYINTFLWLPVANIFGAIIAKIQVMMLNSDIVRIQNGVDVDKADYGYMIFLVIAICGYLTVPSVAGWIVAASGMTNITRLATGKAGAAGNMAASAAGAAGGAAVGGAVAVGRAMGSVPGAPSVANSTGYKNTTASSR
ncbi:TraJ family protein conjugative transposon [Hymenobacter roseosalivarius DSM 11622]|uniref:TraJ family protein conjugative transposon n=1 Tax=Hymenobacter roseosalivarius DSM 11622 TaxID=645990 RepID=A0A1W1UIQ5_9BACT|nr:conjugative transposon protein TraJ [Hymenobacter roseosalivarius]SMB80957.1 TraJ family protein conjugative transposon [Hymenobacter roseosalivarius DSM 11622]